MLELLMIGASVVAMYRIAEMEKKSGLAWGALTLGLCVGCMFLISWPYLNIGIGFALSLGAMFITNILTGPR